MEVKPGFKKTEVGVIPQEWREASLSSLIEKESRITYGVVKPGRNDIDGVLFIRGGDIFSGRIHETQLRRIPNSVSEQYKRTRLYGGEILISLVGYPGEAALVPKHLRGANIARQVALVRLNKDLPINPEFVCKFLQSDVGRRQLLKEAIGSAQQVINLRDIQKVAVALPPTELEQRAIAATLSDVDALLDGLDRLIAKKRNLKQAAMQQLLTGQRRLPGFHGEWEVKRLGDVGDIRSGGTPSTTQAHFWDGDVPWCTPTDITGLRGRKYLIDTARTISAAGLQSSSAEVIPPRSLIMTSRATIGECAINLVAMTTNQGFKNIVPFTGIDVELLYYLMTTQKTGLIALCGGSTFLEIGKKQLSAYKITLPKDRAEQTAIAAVLSDMDAELAALEKRRDKTRDLKQAMMQELLTGKTRLVPAAAAHA